LASEFRYVLLQNPPPPRTAVCPYTTLFRSHKQSENLFSKVLSGPLAKEVAQLNDWTSFDSKITQDYIKLNGVALNDQESTNTLRSEEHTSELQSRENHVCRLLREKKKDAKA